MGLWTMIFLLAMAGMIFAAWKHHHDAKNGIVRDAYGDPVPDKSLGKKREAELKNEIEDLRERIKVLERIATDDRDSKRIAHEIEQLRDK